MRKVPLGEICRFEYGKSLPDKSRQPGNATVYGSNGQVGTHKIGFTAGKTIIVGRKGSIGEIHLSDISCWPIDTTYFIDETCTDCDPEWLSYGLKHLGLGTLNKASGVPGLNRDDAYSQLIWLPASKEKQRQIATRLKAQLAEVETARQAAQVQLRDAAALKTKALESLFSSITNWVPIGDVAKLQSGYAFKSDNFKTSGVRLLRNANILPGKVYWDDTVFLSEDDSQKFSSYALNTGDVLISLDRPIISSGIKVARVGADDLPALLLQRVGRFQIDPQKLDADYLYAFLQTDLFISKVSGHDQSLGVPHISPSQVEAIEIPLPNISVQRKLSSQLNDVSSTWQTAVTAMQLQLHDLSKLPKAILAQAFDQQENDHDR